MLEEMEKYRKKALKKIIIGVFITFIASLLVSVAIGFDFFMLPSTVGIIVLVIITSKDIEKFREIYKKNIVLTAFNETFTDIEYNIDFGIPARVIEETEMMRMGNTYSSNDYVKGKYKNINFEMSDVHIEDVYTDSDGDTHRVTIFKGQWFIFDFNKNFKANIQVCEKNFGNNKKGRLFSGQKYQKVELEDIEFNKTFKVYAINQLDAFYVLTPHTMEKIKEVNNKIKGKILFCFIENKLHIGLYNSKDMYEVSIFKKVNLEEAKIKVRDEMSVITNFVDVLSLDNDLFKINY